MSDRAALEDDSVVPDRAGQQVRWIGSIVGVQGRAVRQSGGSGRRAGRWWSGGAPTRRNAPSSASLPRCASNGSATPSTAGTSSADLTREAERRHQRRPLATQRLICRVQAEEAGVGPGHDPQLGSGRVQHTPVRREPEPAAFGLPALGRGISGQREQSLRVEASDLDRSTHRVGFDHVYSQPDATDDSTPESGLERELWRCIFEVFLQTCLAVQGRPELGVRLRRSCRTAVGADLWSPAGR